MLYVGYILKHNNTISLVNITPSLQTTGTLFRTHSNMHSSHRMEYFPKWASRFAQAIASTLPGGFHFLARATYPYVYCVTRSCTKHRKLTKVKLYRI